MPANPGFGHAIARSENEDGQFAQRRTNAETTRLMATTREALRIAVGHHQAGRLQAAEQIYRQVLAADPNDPDALHLLGVIAYQTGRHDLAVEYIERAIRLQGKVAFFHNNLGAAYKALQRLPEAIACFRRAAELRPDYAEAHNNLGLALQDQGDLEGAIACYNRAVKSKADYAEAHNNLGIALQRQGKPDQALISYRRALEVKQNYVDPLFNEANVLRELGRLDEAVTGYRRVLAIAPDRVDALNNLGMALQTQGELDGAIACYNRALELDPGRAETYCNRGVAYKDQGKLNEAIACYRRALELDQNLAVAYCNLGDAVKVLGAFQESLACCRRAVELQPGFAGAHGNLGSVLEEMGDLHGAEASFRTALRHDPRFALARYKLANLLAAKLPEEDLTALRGLAELACASDGRGVLSDWDRSLLHFGLARVLDARGAYEEAAAHADRANALRSCESRKRGKEYDAARHEAFTADTIAVCTPEFFQRTAGFGLDAEAPVFVFGLPRSGTTLVEQVLAGHSQVFAAGELNLAFETVEALAEAGVTPIEGLRRLDAATAQRLASAHLERLRALDPAATRIVNKMPDNYLLLGLLATIFPRAKFIHCRRDLRDVAISCWMTAFRGIRWVNDRQHMASRLQTYRKLMEHWRKVLPVPLLEVDYEEAVADLEGAARRLVAWCGLEWEPACLDFHFAKRPVGTASAVQVRRPLYTTSVARWKHYEKSLASLLSVVPGGLLTVPAPDQ
jgi:tetratricopeptide (TPR) repeat protein